MLRLADTSPFTLAGREFRVRESVRVTVRVGGVKLVRDVRATAGGRFSLRFPGLEPQDRCGGELWASAVGARGSRATLKLPPPQCPPSLSP